MGHRKFSDIVGRIDDERRARIEAIKEDARLRQPRGAYNATARRSGEWWSIEVTHGLDHATLGVTQTRHRTDIDRATRTVISELAEIAVEDVIVDIEIADDANESPADTSFKS